MTLWFASGNAHKKAELAAILNMELKIPPDAGLSFAPEETGTGFHENALLKARELYRLLSENGLCRPGDPVIADDSGLCVDALDGRPGIYSARYAGTLEATLQGKGKKMTAAQRNALLLEELSFTSRRSARFVCAMTLFYSPCQFYMATESLEGEIVNGPEKIKGTGGFGFDPIFYIPSLNRTLAELSEAEKNRVSHRGKAGKVIALLLRQQGAE